MKISKQIPIILCLPLLAGMPVNGKTAKQSLVEVKVAEVNQVKTKMEEDQRRLEEEQRQAEEQARQEAEQKAKEEAEAKEASEQTTSTATSSADQTGSTTWSGSVLSAAAGVNCGPSGKETYYNLDMSGVVSIMRGMGFSEVEYPYSVRSDGAKMLGNYIMVAANLSTHPRGSLVETSMGTGIVCDTGGFAAGNANQLDIATTW